MRQPQDNSREANSGTSDRRCRPRLEGLEERILLYSTLNAQWAYGSRITYSFVPDGTPVGSTPSSLFQTLSSLGSKEVWQKEFAQAAAVWQAVANINLVQVPDNGAGLGSPGYQQGSPYYGDIRISAIPLGAGTLGAAYSPPPINGGTLAGDIVLNSNVSWKIDANYDLETVAIHELGHALGMDHSTIGQAVMYYYYTGIKQNATNDDAAGIRTLYGPRQYDSWNSGGESNQIWYNAKSLDRFRTPQNQITLTNLDITEPTMTEWFWVTIPQNNIGSFTVTAQSTNLSVLTPQVMVYDQWLNYLGQSSGVTSGQGSAAILPITGVSTGQGFFIRISSATAGGTGAYALQINFGTTQMTAVQPTYVTFASQASQGGGISQMTTVGPIAPTDTRGALGSAAEVVQNWLASVQGGGHEKHGLVQTGTLSAWGDSLMIGPEPTVATHAQFASASIAFSGIQTSINEAADSVRLAPLSTASGSSDGHAGTATSFDHALADWSTDNPSRMRRSAWRF